MKLHGRIWVEETPGGGAILKLAFPAVEKGETPRRTAQTSVA